MISRPYEPPVSNSIGSNDVGIPLRIARPTMSSLVAINNSATIGAARSGSRRSGTMRM